MTPKRTPRRSPSRSTNTSRRTPSCSTSSVSRTTPTRRTWSANSASRARARRSLFEAAVEVRDGVAHDLLLHRVRIVNALRIPRHEDEAVLRVLVLLPFDRLARFLRQLI